MYPNMLSTGLSSPGVRVAPAAGAGGRATGAPGAPLDDYTGSSPLDPVDFYRLREKMPIVTGKAPEPRPDVGLSTLHNCPRLKRVPSPQFTVASGGNVVEVSARQLGVKKSTGGRRGKVRDFSRASRRRLLRLLNSIDRTKVTNLPIFLTLTYPKVWPSDPVVWKTHLVAFCKRLERAYPKLGIVWRLELQKRGAPHYHLLLFGVHGIPFGWIARSWYEVVGSGDPKHLAAGTRVERVRSWNGVNSYAAKYMGKVNEELIGPEWKGRWWGVRRRENLPIAWASIGLEWKEFYRVRRVMRKYVKKRGMSAHTSKRTWQGMSVFMACDLGVRLYLWAISS